jgi:NADPH-dependent curcumin reductase CurA
MEIFRRSPSDTSHEVRRIRMGRKPPGLIAVDDFVMDEVALSEPRQGEVLTQTLYLSMDPYLTRYMREWQGPQPEWNEGVIVGRTIARVVASKSEAFEEGDLVLGNGRWQDYDLRAGTQLNRIRTHPAPVTACVGVLGSSGLTAWAGVTQILKADAGQTLTLSAAAGTVGAIAGQIARQRGCRVVGIAGGAEKCAYVVDELGFDACIDHKSVGFEERFAAAVPAGIDRHFENVGARMLDAAIGSANKHAVIALCGLIAHYQDERPVALAHFRDLLYNSIVVRPFHFADFADYFDEAAQQLRTWLAEGRLTLRETITDGLENAPKAYVGMLAGEGFGKHLVKVHERV